MREAGEVVDTGDQDVLHSAILKVVEDAEPELRGLVFTDPHAQYVLVAVQIDADDHVGRFVYEWRPGKQPNKRLATGGSATP